MQITETAQSGRGSYCHVLISGIYQTITSVVIDGITCLLYQLEHMQKYTQPIIDEVSLQKSSRYFGR